tara:strand:+ start:438 stop:1640 length:1203 start_codon:yes stop_codon:yes gene_type:complete
LEINKSETLFRKKLFLYLAICGSLIPLIFFKYINFLITIFLNLKSRETSTNQLFLEVFLPLGISFFTFQALAYTIDTYRKNIKPKKSLIDFALFISFFPQLIAGPIMRATEFFPQLEAPKYLNFKNIEGGIYLILWGLLKKVVIADNLSFIVNSYFSDPETGFFTAWYAIYAFAFQIYCDFSGYCDIALGCAIILNFKIPLNFRQPYLSSNITSFWHNWHITLSNWFRDYLYIPLGGSRMGLWGFYRNIFIVMVVAGLWHGANYTFVVWGAYHGVLLILHKIYSRFFRVEIPRLVGIFLTFHLVCLGWIFFRAENIGSAWFIFSSAINLPGINVENFFLNKNLFLLIVPLIFLQIAERRFSLKQNFINFPFAFKSVFISVSLIVITIFGIHANDFIYFEF